VDLFYWEVEKYLSELNTLLDLE